MWARAAEIALGLWLVVSPWIFGSFGRQPELVWSSMAAGGAVILLACLSCFRRLERIHLLELGVCAWLVGHGYFGAAHPAPAAAQNEILVGLTLLLFAIVPPDPSQPPRPWRDFLEEQARLQADPAPGSRRQR